MWKVSIRNTEICPIPAPLRQHFMVLAIYNLFIRDFLEFLKVSITTAALFQ